ncbi:hypothetical protein C8R42DRAFT_193145 [Lentinula raphanica]|nr:hypothetical protein C8R42DRAFT_193145 [Lentinula raphanica]
MRAMHMWSPIHLRVITSCYCGWGCVYSTCLPCLPRQSPMKMHSAIACNSSSTTLIRRPSNLFSFLLREAFHHSLCVMCLSRNTDLDSFLSSLTSLAVLEVKNP